MSARSVAPFTGVISRWELAAGQDDRLSGEQAHASAQATDAATVTVHLALTEVMRAAATASELDASTMTAIAQSARQSVSGALHAAMTLVVDARGGDPTLEFGGATDDVAATLIRSELSHRAGPTFAAVVRRASVSRWDGVRFDGRWVGVRAEAERVGVDAALAVPIVDHVHGSGIAVLTFWASSAEGFPAHALVEAETVAALFSVAVTAARSNNQFQAALRSRDVIGQAKGMIMERFRVDATRAFALLAKLSQDSNVPLATVASDLVAAERLDDGGGTTEPRGRLADQPTG